MIIWVVLLIVYLASTIPLARQGWGRGLRRRVVRPARAVHALRRPDARRARRAA